MKIVWDVESAGREDNAAVKFAKDSAIEPPTETRIAPTGGTVPLLRWELVLFAVAVAVGDDGEVVVPVPLVPDAEKLKDGT